MIYFSQLLAVPCVGPSGNHGWWHESGAMRVQKQRHQQVPGTVPGQDGKQLGGSQTLQQEAQQVLPPGDRLWAGGLSQIQIQITLLSRRKFICGT